MDEPTNHLDMEMRHALTVAIQSFKGAIVLISHDRHLLNSSVDSFYLVENGKLEVFNGDLEDYKNLILNIKNFDNKTITKKKKNKAVDREDGIKQSKNLKSEISKLEKRLQRLNNKLNDANEELANPDLYSGNPSDNLQDLIRNQLELSNEVERVEKEWIENVTKLEKLTN